MYAKSCSLSTGDMLNSFRSNIDKLWQTVTKYTRANELKNTEPQMELKIALRSGKVQDLTLSPGYVLPEHWSGEF